jgi:hypothetical protein
MLAKMALLNGRLKTVGIAFAANIVFTQCSSPKRRRAIKAAVARFREQAGGDFRFFRVDGTSFEWDGKNPKRVWSTINKKLSRPGSYDGYAFFCTREEPYTQPVKLAIYARPNYTTDADAPATFGFVIQLVLSRPELDAYAKLFHDTCIALEADQGHFGPTITDRAQYYYDGTRQIDGKRKAEVARVLKAFPGLDLHYVDAMELPWIDYEAREPRSGNGEVAWGLRWPAWQTFVGKRWRFKAPKGAIRTSAGTLVVGEFPWLDGRHARAMGRATKQLRLVADFMKGHAFLYELSREERNRWIRRFDR